MENLPLLLKIAAGLCGFYLLSVVGACRLGSFDPMEAKAKLAFTACLAVGVVAFCLHWSVGCAILILAFVLYFWTKSYLRKQQKP